MVTRAVLHASASKRFWLEKVNQATSPPKEAEVKEEAASGPCTFEPCFWLVSIV